MLVAGKEATRVLSPVRLSRDSSRHRAGELAGGCRGVGGQQAARWRRKDADLGSLGFGRVKKKKEERDGQMGFKNNPMLPAFHARIDRCTSPPLKFQKNDKVCPSFLKLTKDFING